MQPVDTFVACYIIGMMVVFMILGIAAYKNKKSRGETIE